MAEKLKEFKIDLEEPKSEEDVQLPELPQWDKIFGRPTSLEDLDPTAEALLESDHATILTLGDVAYLDSITTTYITDDAITTPKILAGAVTASRISVGDLSAINADLGSITAGSITGVTITGGTVRTSSSGARVQMLSSTNTLQILDSGGTVRAESYSNGWQFNNTVGSASGRIFIEDSLQTLTIQAVSSDLFLTSISNISFAPYNGAIKAFFDTSGLNMNDDIDMNNNEIVDAGAIELGGVRRTSWPSSSGANTSLSNLTTTDINEDLDPASIARDLGSSAKRWGNLYVDYINLDGGGYIDEARAFYFELGRTTNPVVSGEIRYYDGATKGFRGFVNGFLGQFDLSSV